MLLLGTLTVGLLTGCGGASTTSAAPATPATSAAPSAAAASSATASPAGDASSAAQPGGGDAGAGAKYAPIVCKALKETLAGLEGQSAAAAGYQAQMVLTMASTTIPPAELKSSMDDAAVSALCPDDYKDFLEKAKISALSGL
jgi:hypothetical protein